MRTLRRLGPLGWAGVVIGVVSAILSFRLIWTGTTGHDFRTAMLFAKGFMFVGPALVVFDVVRARRVGS